MPVRVSLAWKIQVGREVDRPEPAKKGLADRPSRRREPENGTMRQEPVGFVQEAA
jgi:hypothetical protein